MLVFFLLLPIYLLTYQGITVGDGIIHFHTVENFVKTGSLSLPDNIYNKHNLIKAFMKQGSDGKIYSSLPPGLSILSLPFGLVGFNIERALNAKSTNKYDSIYNNNEEISRLRKTPAAFTVGLVNPILMALALMFFYKTSLLLHDGTKRIPLLLTVICGLGTILWPYAVTYWTQPLDTFCLMGALYFLLSYTKNGDKSNLVASGLMSGFSVFSRFESVISIFWLSAFVTFWLLRERKWQRLFLYNIPIILIVVILLWWNYYRFGSPWDTGSALSGNYLKMLRGKLLQSLPANLFSLHRSIFVYSPPLILCVASIYCFLKKNLLFTTLLALIVLSNFLFYSKFFFWSAPSSWGPRYLVSIVPLMMVPPICLNYKNKWIFTAVLLLFISGTLVQIIGSVKSLQIDTQLSTQYWGNEYFNPASYYRKSDIIVQAKSLISEGPELWWLGSLGGKVTAICLAMISTISGALLVKHVNHAC